MFSAREIQGLSQNAPENLIFCSTDLLLKYCAKPRINPEPCIAEFFARWLLKKTDPVLKAELARFLPESVIDGVYDRIYGDLFSSHSVLIPDDPLWNTADLSQRRYELAIHQRLVSLFQITEGFIPVFFGEKGFFLPFHFESIEEQPELPLICDSAGKKIENWEEAYSELFQGIPPFRCVLHCKQELIPYPLTGHSFMLPVYLATLRRQGKLFYNPRRLIATGEIREGKLTAVELQEKIKAFQSTFARDAFFICPEKAAFIPDLPCILTLKEGRTCKCLTEDVAKYIEIYSLGMPSFQYALSRLSEITEEIRHDTYSHWQDMLNRLNSNAEAIPAYRNPENHLLCLMLRNALYCHMGDTGNAKKWNAEAQLFAARHNFQKQLLRLQIEELVELLDQEDFLQIQLRAPELEKKIAETADPDLKMRFYGTMGQAHCYGAISACQGFAKDVALQYFRNALIYANELNSEPEIAQDLNYIHLWYALFEPGTLQEERAFQDARNNIQANLLQQRPGTAEKNKKFLLRQKNFALYRATLTGQEISRSVWRQYNFEAESWMLAVTCKYQAVLCAIQNDLDSARELFERGLSAISDDCESGIFCKIKLTVYAEAMRFFPEIYRKRAKDFLANHASVFTSSQDIPWCDLINEKSDKSPGLTYWY